MSGDAALSVLARSLDQLGDLLVHVSADRLDARTPCSDWTLGDLADHVVAAPAKFAIMVRGEQPDWSKAPEHLESGWAPAFRSSRTSSCSRWHQSDVGEHGPGLDDCGVRRAHVGPGPRPGSVRPVTSIPRWPSRGWRSCGANLRAEIRGEAFGPEQPAPETGDAYDAIAAFAGRTVSA